MSITINDILLAEHYLSLISKLKYREDLTLQQKRDLIFEADKYVQKHIKMPFTIKTAFGKEMFKQFFAALYELVDDIHSAYGYFHVLFDRLEPTEWDDRH